MTDNARLAQSTPNGDPESIHMYSKSGISPNGTMVQRPFSAFLHRSTADHYAIDGSHKMSPLMTRAAYLLINTTFFGKTLTALNVAFRVLTPSLRLTILLFCVSRKDDTPATLLLPTIIFGLHTC